MIKRADAENYYEIRQEIEEKNQNFLGVVLRDEEKRLDEHLKKLIDECRDVCGGTIPCDVPVLNNPKLWRTGLYSFCRNLPKGADLHVHGTALMPMWRLIKFVSKRDDILIDPETYVLYLRKNADSKCLPLGEALEEGIVDRGTLEKRWTILGCEKDENVWRYFEDLFAYHGAIDEDMTILHDYYIQAFEDCIKSGIFHLELHVLLSESLDYTLEIVNTIRNAYYESKRIYPELSVRIIGTSMKMFSCSMEETQRVIASCLKASETVKDDFDPANVQNFVIGFDLVNEEDTSRSLKEYAPMFLELGEKYPDFMYFLHCGESLNSTNDNLIDAYLLGSTRVGHGMNLYRYPDLLRRYAKEEICLEVCPISNQTLGYTHDIRLHPGAEYLKRGVTIALCSDDPIYQEHEQLTDDFFSAIVAWGLGVAEVKQLCINSILYSALDEKSRRALLKIWNKAWKNFINAQLGQ